MLGRTLVLTAILRTRQLRILFRNSNRLDRPKLHQQKKGFSYVRVIELLPIPPLYIPVLLEKGSQPAAPPPLLPPAITQEADEERAVESAQDAASNRCNLALDQAHPFTACSSSTQQEEGTRGSAIMTGEALGGSVTSGQLQVREHGWLSTHCIDATSVYRLQN